MSAIYVTLACIVSYIISLSVLVLHITKECRHQIISKSVLIPEAVYSFCYHSTQNAEEGSCPTWQPRPWRWGELPHLPLVWLSDVSSRREWNYKELLLTVSCSPEFFLPLEGL